MKTKKLTRTLFFIAIIFLTGCQKELSTENNGPTNPPAILNDTATLLKIVNINYDINGIATDSTLRIIKNAYVNGQKRIVAREYELPAGTDTIYTIFNYDLQNRLVTILDSSAVPSNSYIYHENIYWQNNKVVKIVSDDNGIPYATDDIIYTTNGSNTLISTKRTPSQDSLFFGGVLFRILKYNSFLTVDNLFKPVSKADISWSYLVNGIAQGSPGYSYDTSNTVFSFDVKSNLAGQTEYHTSIDTNYRSASTINHHKDTMTFIFSRDLSENPQLFDLAKNIFGNDLLTLCNHFNLDFDLGEVLGDIYTANTINNNFLHFDFYTQAINKITYNAVFWTDGIKDSNNPPIVNAEMYKATNIFDTQNRLIKSYVYDPSVTKTVYQVRYIYP